LIKESQHVRIVLVIVLVAKRLLGEDTQDFAVLKAKSISKHRMLLRESINFI